MRIGTEFGGTRIAAVAMDRCGRIVERTSVGDRHAEQCRARQVRRMAKALAHVVSVLAPDLIVLGGGFSKVERLHVNVPRRWPEFVFSDWVDTRLAPLPTVTRAGRAARHWAPHQ